MEVILLQDVKSLGKKGEVVKVNDGYARNFILPKKLGVEKNDKSMHELKLQKAAVKRNSRKFLRKHRLWQRILKPAVLHLKSKPVKAVVPLVLFLLKKLQWH